MLYSPLDLHLPLSQVSLVAVEPTQTQTQTHTHVKHAYKALYRIVSTFYVSYLLLTLPMCPPNNKNKRKQNKNKRISETKENESISCLVLQL